MFFFSLMESLEFLDYSKIDIFTDKKIYEVNHDNFIKSDKISYHFEFDDKILSSADCVMTDVFNSMNDKEDKERVLSKYKVNEDLMKKTPDSAVFMHCLPAKIGSEVTSRSY